MFYYLISKASKSLMSPLSPCRREHARCVLMTAARVESTLLRVYRRRGQRDSGFPAGISKDDAKIHNPTLFPGDRSKCIPCMKGGERLNLHPHERREGRESEQLQQSDPRLIPLFGTPGLTHSPGGDAASGNFHLNV